MDEMTRKILLYTLTVCIASGVVSAASQIAPIEQTWTLTVTDDINMELNATIQQMNLTVYEIMLDVHPDTTTNNGYKWDAVLCNQGGLSNPKVMYEDAQGGFNNAQWLDLNYGYLPEFGIDTMWCNDTGNFGYTLFSSGSKNQLPESFRVMVNDQADAFRIYAGTGSVQIDASLDSNGLGFSQKNLCVDNDGYFHVAYISSTDVFYANSTDGGFTWNTGISGIDTGGSYGAKAGILCLTNNTKFVYYGDSTQMKFKMSDDGFSTEYSAGGSSTVSPVMDAIEGEPNKVYMCGIAISDTWFYNASSGVGVEIHASDSDHCSIAYDDMTGNLEIGILDSQTDDFDIMTTADNWATRTQVYAGGTVGGAGEGISMLFKDGVRYAAFIDVDDLQLCIDDTCTELDNSPSNNPHIEISPDNEFWIVYAQTISTSNSLFFANGTSTTNYNSRQSLNSESGATPSGEIYDGRYHYVFDDGGVRYSNLSIKTYPHNLDVDYPTASSQLTTSSGQTETVGFKVFKDSTEVTSGVDILNVTINNEPAPLLKSDTTIETLTVLDSSTYSQADVYFRFSTENFYGGLFRYDISSLDAGKIISKAEICGNIENVQGTPDTNTRTWRFDDQTWTEASAAGTVSGGTYTNQTDSTWNTTTSGSYGCTDVTNAVKTDYDLGNTYSSFRVEAVAYLVDIANVDGLVDFNSIFIGDGAGTTNYLGIDDREGGNQDLIITLSEPTTVYQFGYNGTAWTANITTPTLADGTYDFFVNATDADGFVVNETQAGSVVYSTGGGGDCWDSDLSSDCLVDCSAASITATINANGFNLITEGTGVVDMTGKLYNYNRVEVNPGCAIACWNTGGCFE